MCSGKKKLLFGKGKMGRRKDDLFTVCVAQSILDPVVGSL